MRTYYSKGLNFAIDFPDEWTIEEEGNILSVYNSVNGSGALQFSSYTVDHIDSVNLVVELEDYVSKRHNDFKVQNLNGTVFCKCKDQDGSQWQYWIFAKGNILVFASYNCSSEDIGKEDFEIRAIVESAIKNGHMNPA